MSGRHRSDGEDALMSLVANPGRLEQVYEAETTAVSAEDRRRTTAGLALGGTALAGVTASIWAAVSKPDWKVARELPFVETAQQVVANMDQVLVPVGQFGLPAAVAAIALTKLGARHNSRMLFADKYSGDEPNTDSRSSIPLLRRMRKGTGLAMAGGALATFTAGIATEVSEGPSRPVDALSEVAPGDFLITQDEYAMPMVQSNVNSGLKARVMTEATEAGVKATAVDLFLSTTTHQNESGKEAKRTALAIGVDADAASGINWDTSLGCYDEEHPVPAIVDSAADIPEGDTFEMGKIKFEAVGITTEGISAMNRVGVVVSGDAMAECLRQHPDAPPHAIVLDTDDAETAEAILDSANAELGHPATVISKDRYKDNSEDFWKNNVKPITNVLSVTAGGFALLAMSGAMASRILRNRRSLAVKLGSQASPNVLRATEMLRATKDGVIASIGGVAAGTVATIGSNSLVSGFNAGVGIREASIGSGLALLGTVAGSAASLLGLKRTAAPSKNTRV